MPIDLQEDPRAEAYRSEYFDEMDLVSRARKRGRDGWKRWHVNVARGEATLDILTVRFYVACNYPFGRNSHNWGGRELETSIDCDAFEDAFWAIEEVIARTAA